MSDKVKLFCEAKNYVKLFKILRKKMKKCLGQLELYIQNHGFGKRLVRHIQQKFNKKNLNHLVFKFN